MRALACKIEFSKFLKLIGNGDSNVEEDLSVDIMKISQQCLFGSGSIIKGIYNNLPDFQEMSDRAILAPRTKDCVAINDCIINISDETKDYFSADRALFDNNNEYYTFRTKFLNSLSVSGLPPSQINSERRCSCDPYKKCENIQINYQWDTNAIEKLQSLTKF